MKAYAQVYIIFKNGVAIKQQFYNRLSFEEKMLLLQKHGGISHRLKIGQLVIDSIYREIVAA